MFEDLFNDILDVDDKEEKDIKDEEINESDFELFREDKKEEELPDMWITSNISVDDADIWSTDDVWDSAN